MFSIVIGVNRDVIVCILYILCIIIMYISYVY